jgi:cell division protein FtsB
MSKVNFVARINNLHKENTKLDRKVNKLKNKTVQELKIRQIAKYQIN